MLQCSWCKQRIWWRAKHFLDQSFHDLCGWHYLRSQFEEIHSKRIQGCMNPIDAAIQLLKLEIVKNNNGYWNYIKYKR